MDTKGSPKSTVNLTAEPLINKQRIVYIAVKGSLHASDFSVFGLDENEVKLLFKKYEPVLNGFAITLDVLNGLNLLSKLGYSIVSTTGEVEITWTMQKQLF